MMVIVNIAVALVKVVFFYLQGVGCGYITLCVLSGVAVFKGLKLLTKLYSSCRTNVCEN